MGFVLQKPAYLAELLAPHESLLTSDGSVVSFQKTAVAVLASVVIFFKTAVAVITYNFNSTENWRKFKKILCIKEI